jgi:hypothetical protein
MDKGRMTDQEKDQLDAGFSKFGFSVRFLEDAKGSWVLFSKEHAEKILNQLKVLDKAAGKL